MSIRDSSWPMLEKNFESREALIAYVQEHAPWAMGKASNVRGGRMAAEMLMESMDPIAYAATRNYADGSVTGLPLIFATALLA